LLLALCLAPRIGQASRGNYVNRYSLDDLPFKDKDAPFWLLQQGKSSAPAIKWICHRLTLAPVQRPYLEKFTLDPVKKALTSCDGHVTQAMDKLGADRSSLYRYIERLPKDLASPP
jgi:transcriptional regulator of acetoin/glycerol metabolism